MLGGIGAVVIADHGLVAGEQNVALKIVRAGFQRRAQLADEGQEPLVRLLDGRRGGAGLFDLGLRRAVGAHLFGHFEAMRERQIFVFWRTEVAVEPDSAADHRRAQRDCGPDRGRARGFRFGLPRFVGLEQAAGDLDTGTFGVFFGNHAAGRIAIDLFELVAVDLHLDLRRRGAVGPDPARFEQRERQRHGGQEGDGSGDDPKGHVRVRQRVSVGKVYPADGLCETPYDVGVTEWPETGGSRLGNQWLLRALFFQSSAMCGHTK